MWVEPGATEASTYDIPPGYHGLVSVVTEYTGDAVLPSLMTW